MAPVKRRKQHYGDQQSGIRDELVRYSRANGYRAEHFADAVCGCGNRCFRLSLDDDAGAAVRECVRCGDRHPMGDSAEFLADADLADCVCPCGAEAFEITAGVSLYRNTEDVKWLYLGCRCPQCGLTAVYGDWKNEFQGYRRLLRRI